MCVCDCEAPRVSVVVRSCLTVTVLGWAPSFQSLFSRHTHFLLGSCNFSRVFSVFYFLFDQSGSLCALWARFGISKTIDEIVSRFFPPKNNTRNQLDLTHLTHEGAPSFSRLFCCWCAPFFRSAAKSFRWENTHTRSYRDASISFMNRRKIRSTDRGGKTFHTTDGLLIGHSIVSLDLAKKKEKTIDRIPDFIFLFSPFKKFIFTLRKDQKEQMDEKRPSSFFFPSFLVTHSKKTFSPPLF